MSSSFTCIYIYIYTYRLLTAYFVQIISDILSLYTQIKKPLNIFIFQNKTYFIINPNTIQPIKKHSTEFKQQKQQNYI